VAEREAVEVTVEIDGQDFIAGTLWLHEQRAENSTFRYSDSYLASPVSYDLEPAMPKIGRDFSVGPAEATFQRVRRHRPRPVGQEPYASRRA
jgi:serine/threonine-protein kinase HipA